MPNPILPNWPSMLADLPPFVSNHLDWAVSGLIVVLGLFVYGLPDLLRARLGRVWAISGVCFRDAIRRRVLWITPLAMLGILAVAQFQKPIDEQDAVRLTVKVCLFTTGLVVTIIALVTAATNLPREIENRVIFTIVTKPVSRLEIVVGKVVGFARVSAAMLVVMGLFTLGYLHLQAFFLNRQIAAALQSPSLEPSRRDWLEHYQAQGLLQSQSVDEATTLMQFARPPEGDAGGWILGGSQDALVRFDLDPKALVSAAAPDSPGGSVGIGVVLHVGYEPLAGASGEKAAAPAAPAAPPRVAIQLLDPVSGNVLLSAEQLGRGSSAVLTDPTGERATVIQIGPDRATQLASLRAVDVQILGAGGGYLYDIKPDALSLVVPDSQTTSHTIKMAYPPLLRGSATRTGQQLAAATRGVQPVAVYAYRGVAAPTVRDGRVPFEINVAVERGGVDSETELNGTVEVRAYDRKRHKLSPPEIIYPENKRTAFFDLPAEYLTGGDFDLQLRNRGTGHSLSLTPGAVTMVGGHEYFGFNLIKALLVLWLLAILTATVAFWCSTFLSWPIAVVLTVLIVLGHWAVSNVDLGSGIGAQVANELFQNNSGMASVVNKSVESLSHALTVLASVLPDIGPFGVSDRIERGLTLSPKEMLAPLGVLALFGLPLITVAYVFLRNKEVAP